MLQPTSTFQKELKTYNRMIDSLRGKHKFMFVLISHKKLIGVYPQDSEHMKKEIDKLWNKKPFLVKSIEKEGNFSYYHHRNGDLISL